MLQVRIDGVRELTRAIKRISPDTIKALGQKNKAIGERIISRAMPKPESVGSGAGAKPRPSASRNVLKIIAGGSHRRLKVQQWGRRVVPRQASRPYLLQAAEKDMPHITKEYLDALLDAARRAGLQAKGG